MTLPSSQLPGAQAAPQQAMPPLRAGTGAVLGRRAAAGGTLPAGGPTGSRRVSGGGCFHPLLSNAALPAHGPPAAGGSIGSTSVPPAPHADVTHPPGTLGAEINPRQFQMQGLIRARVYNDNNSG